MIHDSNIAALRKEVFYPVQAMQCLSVFTNAGTAPNLTGSLESQESTTSVLSLITGTKLMGAQVSVANDGYDFIERIPYDLDVDRPIGIRPLYTKDATGTTHVVSFTWTAKYGHIGSLGTIATAATALDTVIAADTQASATDSLKLYIGPRGIVNASKLVQTDILWTWQLLLTAFTTSGNDKMWLLGVLVDYMPHQTIGTGQGRDRPLRTNALGKTWSYSGG